MHPIFKFIDEDNLEAVADLLAHMPSYSRAKLLEAKNDEGDTPLTCAIYKQNVQIIRLLISCGAHVSENPSWDKFFAAKGIGGVIACVPNGPFLPQQVGFICGYALLQRLEQETFTDIKSFFSAEDERKVIHREALKHLLVEILNNVEVKQMTGHLQILEVMMGQLLDSWGLDDPHWKKFRELLEANPFSILNASMIEKRPGPVSQAADQEDDGVEHPTSYLSNGVLKLSTTAYQSLGYLPFAAINHDSLSMEREFPKSK